MGPQILEKKILHKVVQVKPHQEKEVKWVLGIIWMWPPPSNSDHQDYYIFSRESL